MNRPLCSLTLLLSAVLTLAGCSNSGGGIKGANSASAEPPAEVQLRLIAKKGDKFTMNLEMDAEADVSGLKLPANVPAEQKAILEGPQKMTVRSKEERTVTEVKGDEIKIEIKNLSFSAEGTGTLKQAAAGMTATEKDKVESRTYDNFNRRILAPGDRESNPLSVVFPEQPIKPGYTWSNDTEMNGMRVKANYKFERLETVNGKSCAVISLMFSNSASVTSPGPLLLWVDRSNGWPVKGEGKVELDSAETGLKTNLTFRMSAD